MSIKSTNNKPEVPMLYKALADLVVKDNTVYAHLALQQKTGKGDIETAIDLIRSLTYDKQFYFKRLESTLEELEDNESAQLQAKETDK